MSPLTDCPQVTEFFYDSVDLAAQEVARRVAQALQNASREQGESGLIVPGGRSPGRVFQLLAREQVPWGDVTVIPSDERLVPSGDVKRNDVMIKEQLINNLETQPHFISIVNEHAEGDNAPAIADFPWPAEVAILGMGNDGHVASLFPGQQSSWNSHSPCVPGFAPEAPLKRISLSLGTLRETRRTMLLVFGPEKKAMYEKVRDDSALSLPVSALLQPAEGLMEIHVTKEQIRS